MKLSPVLSDIVEISLQSQNILCDPIFLMFEVSSSKVPLRPFPVKIATLESLLKKKSLKKNTH